MITHVEWEMVVSSWPTICGKANTTIEASAKAKPTANRTERFRHDWLDQAPPFNAPAAGTEGA
jgi:hypothetical protein